MSFDNKKEKKNIYCLIFKQKNQLKNKPALIWKSASGWNSTISGANPVAVVLNIFISMKWINETNMLN